MSLTNDTVMKEAKSLGFDLVGFAPAEPLYEETKKLREWLDNDFHAGMDYMTRNVDKRTDVSRLLKNAKSVISLGLIYYTPETHSGDGGKISRYAWGTDYHYIMWDKLKILQENLASHHPGFESVGYVDTGPVMDKVWAVKAGLGWMGKNTNVINREKGSWFFIANIICNVSFEYLEPVADYCGSCTACIDACPTDALKPYQLDSNKCISYLTIENKAEIPEEFSEKFDNWAFGCDVCQDVCPWNNKFSEVTSEARFYPAHGTTITIDDIAGLSGKQFEKKYSESPLKRARLKGIKRNLKFLER
ncbi:MAG: epoxyqueuosine reductase [Melioribacteraceae bacterium]|nr:MAG: epoxyqueuosine reductase [Melioribacteraceae bacterium]